MRKEIIYLIMTVIGGLILLGTTVYTCIMWQKVPDQVPIHYDFAGNVTDYGGKGSMIFMLGIAWVMFIIMTVLVKFPNTWNMPVKVTAENAERLYSITRGMLEAVKLITVILMAFLAISSIIMTDFTDIIIMILAGALLLVIAISIFMMIKNK